MFENLRKNETYAHFLYKEAAPNPTDLRDQADDSETAMVDAFRADPSLKELSGFMDRNGVQVFYISRPLTITSENCLTCHSTPQNAPASLIQTYGTDHGFGWQLNQIVAAQTIYIPAADVFAQAQQALTLVMGIIVALFVVVIVVTNIGLRRAVIRPIIQIARLAQLISSDTLTPNSPELAMLTPLTQRSDEFGHTARLIERMAQQIYARERKLKDTIQSLQIEVDKVRESQEVEQITEFGLFPEFAEAGAGHSRAVGAARERGRIGAREAVMIKRIDLPPGSSLSRPPRAMLGYACLEDTYLRDGVWYPVADWRSWRHGEAVEAFRHAGVVSTGLSVDQVITFYSPGEVFLGYGRVTAIRMSSAERLTRQEIAALDYNDDEYQEFLHFENDAGWYVALERVEPT